MTNDKQRERLVELIIASVNGCARNWAEHITDYLLANGVIVPPCKVGDKIYIVAEVSGKIIECSVIGAWMCEGNCTVITDCGTIYNLSYGETVFLTKEEAEKALKGSEM